MPDSASSVVSTLDSVTIVYPTESVSDLYEGQLEVVGLTTGFASSLATPLMIVDMRNVKFVGSAFLGRMIAIQKELASKPNGRLALVEMCSFCRAALTVSKLDTVLEIYPTIADALKAFGRNG
jgi:anti-anti-sigma regulatory factor